VKNENFKHGSGFIDSDKVNLSGFWSYYDSYDSILMISNLLTEKGLREKNLKSSLKKLISKKFFNNSILQIEENEEKSFLDFLNEMYKQTNAKNQLDRTTNNYREIRKSIKKEIEVDKDEKNRIKNTIDIKEESEFKKYNNNENDIESAITQKNKNKNIKYETQNNKNNKYDSNTINEIEQQNMILNEIIDDIQNIDSQDNNLDNILENEAQLDLIDNDIIDISELKKIVHDKKIEEYKDINENKNVISNNLNKDIINNSSDEIINKANFYNFSQELNQKSNESLITKNIKKQNIYLINEEEKVDEIDKDRYKKEMVELIPIKDKIILMEEKFSEYLKQYEKEWDSPIKRIEWVII